MGERRVLSKFAPPGPLPGEDGLFKAARRRRQPDNQPIKVRMAIPMSIRCDTCRSYIYEGTRVNSRKECCIGEMYLGTQIFMFYFKCTRWRCSAWITLKTDPQNNGYKVESGVTHNVGPWCEEDEINRSSELVLNPPDVLTKTNGSSVLVLNPSDVLTTTNGSSELVLNPSDVLTKTNGPESVSKEENKRSTISTNVNPCKKQKTEPTAGLDDCEEPVAEEHSITTIN